MRRPLFPCIYNRLPGRSQGFSRIHFTYPARMRYLSNVRCMPCADATGVNRPDGTKLESRKAAGLRQAE